MVKDETVSVESPPQECAGTTLERAARIAAGIYSDQNYSKQCRGSPLQRGGTEIPFERALRHCQYLNSVLS
jgi:hypothetical protein